MSKVLRGLNQQQQILYTAMMMDTKQIPLFNQEQSIEANKTGEIIKKMFYEKIYTSMKLDDEGTVVLS